MNHIGMVSPTPGKPSMRQQIRTLEAKVTVQSHEIAKLYEDRDKMAENMTHLILRLEGMREKFGVSVDAVNEIGEAYLAKMAENQAMQRAAADNIKVLEINGVEYKPATPPVVAPMGANIPSANPSEPIQPVSTD